MKIWKKIKPTQFDDNEPSLFDNLEDEEQDND